MASISAIYTLGGIGSLYQMQMPYATPEVGSALAPAALAEGAVAPAIPHRVLGGSGSVHLYARLLTWPDASVRSAAASSLYALLQQMQTIPEYQPRIDLYA